MEHSRISMLRTRWAAIGAAVAVTLGGGGIGITHAVVDSDPKAVYDRLDSPCRLADLRGAPFTVGPRSSPLGPNETYVLDGWGSEGNCTLPTGTAAIEANVTAVDPTAATFLRFWPGDGVQPETANLNPTPGQPPTPNSVTIGLSAADGTFKMFNRFGSVNVIIDIVGVYDDHAHDGADIIDGSLTGADLADGSVGGADVADGTLTAVDLGDEAGVAQAADGAGVNIGASLTTIDSVTIEAPTNGYVIVFGTSQINLAHVNGTASVVNVAVMRGSATGFASDEDHDVEVPSGAPTGTWRVVAGMTKAFSVTAGSNSFKLAANIESGANHLAADYQLTALFVPSAYGTVETS